MQHGVLVEHGAAAQELDAPRHAYSRQLIAAVPSLVPPPPRPIASEAALLVSKVSKTFRTGGFLGRGVRTTQALADVSLTVPKGATLVVVGQSGSGKTT
jgi:peptide/nickel transport system ATP-binding protein